MMIVRIGVCMCANNNPTNIALIGMPSTGKSTVGVVLAKKLGMSFVDTDILISQRTGKTLPQIISDCSIDGLLAIENEVGKTLAVSRCVIATGGSMVLSAQAMKHISTDSVVIWIKTPIDEIEHRIGDIVERGVAAKANDTVRDIYSVRAPFYEEYADMSVNSSDSAEHTADNIIALLKSQKFV